VTESAERVRAAEPDQSGQEPSRDRRRRWVGLFVLALPTILISLDMSVLYLALPS
jgi:MFS transporter, DHA2 family, multidrug resistance protein